MSQVKRHYDLSFVLTTLSCFDMLITGLEVGGYFEVMLQQVFLHFLNPLFLFFHKKTTMIAIFVRFQPFIGGHWQ